MQEIRVDSRSSNQSLYKFVKKVLFNAPESYIHKLFRKKEIRVNNIKQSKDYLLKSKDLVRIYITDDKFFEFSKNIKNNNLNICTDINIIFENEDVVFINKPKGVLSQKKDKKEDSINDYLINRYGESYGFKPSICNRLDRNTTGILTAGKTINGLKELNQIFKEKKVRKIYKTIVFGRVNNVIYDEKLLSRENNISYVSNDGVKIQTKVIPIEHIGEFTLCEVEIFTGKTHQIRMHLKEMGYPILGDIKYGKKCKDIKYQLLHCSDMIFNETCLLGLANKHIKAEIPKEFVDVLGRIKNGNLGY